MEYTYASTGDVTHLREWLQLHPNRVNVACPGTQLTLLQTAAECNRLPIVQMLVDEFNADINCNGGGSNKTALHRAALVGSVPVVAFLISRRAALLRDSFGETPVEQARLPHVNKSLSDMVKCIELLENYDEMIKKTSRTVSTQRTVALGSDGSRYSGSGLSNNSSPPSRNAGAVDANATAAAAALMPQMYNLPAQPRAVISRYGSDSTSGNDARKTSSAAPAAARPNTRARKAVRGRREITDASQLPADIQDVVKMYKWSGSMATETNACYFLRLMIPYVYRDVTYSTPVTIVVDRTVNPAPSNGSGTTDGFYGSNGYSGTTQISDFGFQAAGSMSTPYTYNPSGSNQPLQSTTTVHGAAAASSTQSARCRYRSFIDKERMNGLRMSRRATYLDLASGAIIPSDSDRFYPSLKEYILHVLVECFQRCPPLTTAGSSYGYKDVNVTEPAFKASSSSSNTASPATGSGYPFPDISGSPNSTSSGQLSRSESSVLTTNVTPLYRIYDPRERKLAVLRSVSKFCDGAFDYDPGTQSVSGFIPIFQTQVLPAKSGASPNGNIQMPRMRYKIPLRIEFPKTANDDSAPRVFIPRTAPSTVFFSYATLMPKLQTIVDPSNGQVLNLHALRHWSQHGNLYYLLTMLQKALARKLAPKSGRKNGGSRQPSPGSGHGQQNAQRNASTAQPSTFQRLFGINDNPAVDSDMDSSEYDSGEDGGDVAGNRAGNPHTGGPLRGSTDGGESASTASSSVPPMDAPLCVICMQQPRQVLLFPCKHVPLCSACNVMYSERLKDHLLCPICRAPIESTTEIYI